MEPVPEEPQKLAFRALFSVLYRVEHLLPAAVKIQHFRIQAATSNIDNQRHAEPDLSHQIADYLRPFPGAIDRIHGWDLIDDYIHQEHDGELFKFSPIDQDSAEDVFVLHESEKRKTYKPTFLWVLGSWITWLSRFDSAHRGHHLYGQNMTDHVVCTPEAYMEWAEWQLRKGTVHREPTSSSELISSAERAQGEAKMAEVIRLTWL